MRLIAALLRLIVLGGPVILVGAAAPHPVKAQAGPVLAEPAVPCQAFSRAAGGEWMVLTPVKLTFGAVSMELAPGDVFGPGSMTHGVALPVILDRQCGV